MPSDRLSMIKGPAAAAGTPVAAPSEPRWSRSTQLATFGLAVVTSAAALREASDIAVPATAAFIANLVPLPWSGR